MADQTKTYSGDYGYGWGTTYNNFGPYDTTPQPGQPWQADWPWPEKQYFIDGAYYVDPYAKCDFTGAGPTPDSKWPAYSEVWRMYLTGTGDLIDNANIPVGSKITKLTLSAKWVFSKGYRARMRMSRETSFNESWVGDDSNNIVSNVTGSGYGSTRFLGGDVGEGTNRWNNPQDEVWDFCAGDANISGRVYMYFWFEHPDPDSYGTPSDDYSTYLIELKRLRVYRVSWREPSTGSGILLGNT